MQELIWMQKGDISTQVLSPHKADYIKAGWKVTQSPNTTKPATDPLAKAIADKADPKAVADARNESVATDKEVQASVVVATEMSNPPPKQAPDFLKEDAKQKAPKADKADPKVNKDK